MANFDITTAVGLAYPEFGLAHNFVIPIEIDFSKINNSQGLAASDELTFLKLPAKNFAIQMQVDVEKAEGNTLTFELGDQDANNNWFTGVDGNVVASAISSLIVDGKYFTTTGPTLRLTVNNAANNAIVVVRFICYDLSVKLQKS